MILAGFAKASTTAGSASIWRHPSADARILDADHYINLARMMERGGFHMIFFDDRLAMPAVYGKSPDHAVRRGSNVVKLDLLPILGLITAHTTHLGIGATYSTTYYAPYHVARAFATLDHLSSGRAVWNIVTSLNSSEAENFGADYSGATDRYDRADEFLEIVTGLWESWESDALHMDRLGDTFADPAKVHELNFRGASLSSRGPLTVPRPPQGWPVLLQAGQSGRGMEFASRWADLVFSLPSPDLTRAAESYKHLKQLTAKHGRSPDSLRILPAIQVIVGESEDDAAAQLALIEAYASPEEELISLSEQANFDFATMPMDEPLRDDVVAAIQGGRGLVERNVALAREMYGADATLRDLAKTKAQHGLIRFVGDAQRVSDQMEEWFQRNACDGFAISPAVVPRGYEDVARLVVPELQRRGVLAPTDAEGGTFRARLGLTDRTTARHSPPRS